MQELTPCSQVDLLHAQCSTLLPPTPCTLICLHPLTPPACTGGAGGVHVERLGDSVPFEDMMERIDRWTFSYADGRKVKLNKAVTRTREGDSAAAGLAA